MGHIRQRYDWNRTSALMALIANCHRDPKNSEPFRPDDFSPFAEKKSEGILKLDAKHSVDVLASLFVGGSDGSQRK